MSWRTFLPASMSRGTGCSRATEDCSFLGKGYGLEDVVVIYKRAILLYYKRAISYFESS